MPRDPDSHKKTSALKLHVITHKYCHEYAQPKSLRAYSLIAERLSLYINDSLRLINFNYIENEHTPSSAFFRPIGLYDKAQQTGDAQN